jgi:serine/threonine protein kinase
MYEELGTGATATVYRCVKNGDAKSLAVKVISLKNLRMQKDFQRMQKILNREMQILFSLRHPHIVSLFDVVDTDMSLYLVMELLRDGELFDYIVKKGSLEEPQAKHIFRQTVGALQYIHDKDIVYRDLKPENILVCRNASLPADDPGAIDIKLSDFGHSKLVNDGFSIALTRVGTPQYWAPEVSDPRSAAAGYDKSVDLWSLGVILYVMLLGAYPFDGVKNPVEVQMKNPNLQFVSPVTGRRASDSAQDLVKALIKVKPSDRLALAQCAQHTWLGEQGAQNSVDTKPTNYCSMKLPDRPSKAQRDQMVQDLLQFQKKFRCFAQVRNDAVVADLSYLDEQQAAQAKSDIKGIVRHQFAGYEPLETTIESLSGNSLPPIPEGRYKLSTTTLQVGRNGAGLDLIAENGGMKVEGVLPDPGQSGIQQGNLIVKINEVPLVGAPETVESIFGRNFGNGVQIQVKRSVP